MSEIKGITFSNQAVIPRDDGQIREYIFSDGILSGCELSYSVFTFSVAPGYLIVAGRLMRVPSTIYTAVDQASSGYARILLTIDLTETATTDEFEQVRLDVEYSATENGFPSLVQGNVNAGDTMYQAVVAVVNLGSAGITGMNFAMGAAKIKNAATAYTVTLSDWQNNSVTVDAPGVTAPPEDNAVIVSPHPDSYLVWMESVVRVQAQGSGTLTFACEDMPAEPVKANILIVG